MIFKFLGLLNPFKSKKNEVLDYRMYKSERMLKKLQLKEVETQSEEYQKMVEELYSISDLRIESIAKWKEHFHSYLNTIKERFFIIFPNCDNNEYLTNKNYRKLYSVALKEEIPFHLNYTYLTNIINITFYGLMMLDWDKKDGFTGQRCFDIVKNIVEKGKEYNIKLIFGLSETDRGYHAFLLSNKVDYQSLIDLKFMCSFECDKKYIGYTNLFGWAVRLTRKDPNDFVAKPGWTIHGKEYQVIGPSLTEISNIKDINLECWTYYMYHYYLIEYFKIYTSDELEKFKNTEICYVKEFVNKIRNDIDCIWGYSQTESPRIICNIELPNLNYELYGKSLDYRQVILPESNNKINRNFILTEQVGLNIPALSEGLIETIKKIENYEILKGKPKKNLQTINKYTRYTKYRTDVEKKNNLYLFPNMDYYHDTRFNDVTNLEINTKIKERFSVGVDGQMKSEKRIIFIGYKDLLMLDWDEKDGFNSQECLEIIEFLVEEAKKNGINLCFALTKTDRGVHAFELTRKWDFRDLNTIKLMIGMYCDPWYVSNCNIRGWHVRLSKKVEYINDCVAIEGVNGRFFIGDQNSILPEQLKMYKYHIKLIDYFKNYDSVKMERCLGLDWKLIDKIREDINNIWIS